MKVAIGYTTGYGVRRRGPRGIEIALWSCCCVIRIRRRSETVALGPCCLRQRIRNKGITKAGCGVVAMPMDVWGQTL